MLWGASPPRSAFSAELGARQHGILALLVVVGGYGYLFRDSDYLFGFPHRGWTGLSLYLVMVTLLYLVATPVALLRAKTRLGRALAVFIPAVIFHVARLTIPLLVLPQPPAIRPGDIGLSINALFSLVLAWVLYSYVGDVPREAPSGAIEASLSPS